mgnify:CR=1 FL=1
MGVDAYIQMAGLRLAVLNSLAGVGINGSRPAGVLHQNLSLGSQLQFVFAPIKNFYIELILQQANLMTHRRLGQIQLLSCLSIAPDSITARRVFTFMSNTGPSPSVYKFLYPNQIISFDFITKHYYNQAKQKETQKGVLIMALFYQTWEQQESY